jgi:hypothetical protein
VFVQIGGYYKASCKKLLKVVKFKIHFKYWKMQNSAVISAFIKTIVFVFRSGSHTFGSSSGSTVKISGTKCHPSLQIWSGVKWRALLSKVVQRRDWVLSIHSTWSTSNSSPTGWFSPHLLSVVHETGICPSIHLSIDDLRYVFFC